jgi:hypothetical protein
MVQIIQNLHPGVMNTVVSVALDNVSLTKGKYINKLRLKSEIKYI